MRDETFENVRRRAAAARRSSCSSTRPFAWIQNAVRATLPVSLLAAPALLTLFPAAAGARPVSAALGAEYYSGARDEISRSVSGTVGTTLGSRTAGALAAAFYDDNLLGHGTSLTAGVHVGIRGPVRLRALGAQIWGSDALRAWRMEIGPQIDLPEGRSLSVLFQHYDDNSAVSSNGLRSEIAVSLAARWAARASGAFAATNTGVSAFEGSVGLVWTVLEHMEIAGDVGVAQNGGGGATNRPLPVRRGLNGLPILGEPDPAATPGEPELHDVSPTLLVGLRLLLP